MVFICCSISHNDHVLQSSRHKLGDCAFSVAGPRAWNALPIELKTISDILSFEGSFRIITITNHSNK